MDNGGEINSELDVIDQQTASDMLEDALHHFDTFIDGTGHTNGYERLSEDGDRMGNEFDNGIEGVALLMEDLRNAVEATLDLEVNDDEERNAFTESLLKHITVDTLSFYRKLFKIHNKNENESDKINRLQGENESLTLQVSILTDQIELQTEKVQELEIQLNGAIQRVEGADTRLQEEVATKTSLETQKLALMDEISNYKISIAQKEQKRKLEEVDAAEAERQRLMIEARTDQYKFLMDKLSLMKDKVMKVREEKLDYFNMLTSAQQFAENLETSSNAKDRIIEELQEEINNLKSQTVPKVTSPDEGIVQDQDDKASQDPRLLHLRMPDPRATSTPTSGEQGDLNAAQAKKSEASEQPGGSVSPTTPTGPLLRGAILSQSLEKLHGKRIDENEDALIRSDDSLKSKQTSGSSHTLNRVTASSSKSATLSSWQTSKTSKSNSTPNLAMTETHQPHSRAVEYEEAEPQPHHFHHRKKHGFRKFFTSFRLRRSRSTSLEAGDMTAEALTQKNEHFQRGGVRSTAGPRLGLKARDRTDQSKPLRNDNLPFQRWDADQVCQWLTDIGLGAYSQSGRRWVRSGDTLLRATNHELEKELGIRNALHKKKLMLHLHSLAGGGDDDDAAGAAHMNDIWVARWLDDIGLPQYKDAFHEACMDGRTLHHLTISDAQKLKISNLFHLLSIRRGIEMLRRCHFDPTQLKRRPVGEEETEDICMWTNHRVMEWLRSADLAEYAPNLRGSGVHGAVLVLEPLFTADTLASLLHIPHGKSLLRRHLAAELEGLLPKESIRLKKERAEESGYQPLNVAVKYKVGRRSIGGFRRFRGSSSGSANREFGSGEYVCPISSSAKSKSMACHRTELEKKMHMEEMMEKRSAEAVLDEENVSADSMEVVELNESTTREINAFSAQINSLTSNWTKD